MFLVKWIMSAGVLFSQGMNFVLLGDPSMTLSARTAYARQEGSKTARITCDVFDWIDPRDGDSVEGDHCDIAARSDFERELERQKRKP